MSEYISEAAVLLPNYTDKTSKVPRVNLENVV